jgi:hypothetical protein
MKNDAISPHERGFIIHALDERGKWQDQRIGAQIELGRLQLATGNEIQYTVTMGRRRIDGKCKTVPLAQAVSEVVEAVNAIIRDRQPEPMVGRAARDPRHTGMPQLVRHRHSAPAGERLFEDA